jgi:hypothetical protein
MTLVRYESLRALARACRRWNFVKAEQENIFYKNAKALIEQVRSSNPVR